MKKRDYYLDQLVSYKDKPFIKVITGMRRCGKSSLLSLFEDHLLSSGVTKDHIIRMNFESMANDHIQEYHALYDTITLQMPLKKTQYYLLLDEIQLVESWEKAVNSLLVDANVDIYLTGSNAFLLSSELSTLLSGRYVEIKMLPLSFKEYLDFIDAPKTSTPDDFFPNYLLYGGLPNIPMLLANPETITAFLTGIYNTVIMKDVVQRNLVRDAALLDNVLRLLATNVGNIVSTKKISDYLTSSGRKTTSDTIDNYIRMLESAFIIYRVNRFDIKGKQYLKTQEKFYLVDSGIRYSLTGQRNTDYGHVLENIIYLELLRRGYEVSIGKVGTLEIDFVATKANEKIYYQVSATILDSTTRDRELAPLQVIKDNYKKVILTMDKSVFTDYEGITCVNIIDFLLSD
jgi:uncharacterized protein